MLNYNLYPGFRITDYFIIICIFISGCSFQSRGEIITLNGSTMGTFYNIQINNNNNPIDKDVLAKNINNILELVNGLMSTWREDSEISRVNKISSGQWIKISPDTLYVLELAQSISQQSNGAFDITLNPLIELWGFGVKENHNVVPTDASIKDALQLTGYRNLQIDHKNSSVKKLIPLQINLSAIAKGFAVDKIAMYLNKQNYAGYLVEIGGEIRVKGNKNDETNWKIAIESPMPKVRKAHLIIAITDRAVATSGDYRNFFEKSGRHFSHIIDPATGKPVNYNLVSVSVISKSAARADALATALMAMGPNQGYQFCEENELAALFILKDSNGFKQRITSPFEKYVEKGS